MKVSELKAAIKELTQFYFVKADVSFTKQSFKTKPAEPLVTISVGSVSRPMNPPVKIIDGRPVSFYPASVPVQIDLFTQGRRVEVKPGYTPIVENTAEDDLLGFVSFLNSEYAVNWCHARDIAILVPNTVTDLTDIINDTNYQFRAMVEVTVNFTMEAIGYTGTLDPMSVEHTASETNPEPGHKPGEKYRGGDIQADDVTSLDPEINTTPSGGGNVDLVKEETGYFSNVEINDRPVKKEE